LLPHIRENPPPKMRTIMVWHEMITALDGKCHESLTVMSITLNTTCQVWSHEEIQISENEMASDPERHRSLNKYRRCSYAKLSSIAPRHDLEERGFTHISRSIFSHACNAVMF